MKDDSRPLSQWLMFAAMFIPYTHAFAMGGARGSFSSMGVATNAPVAAAATSLAPFGNNVPHSSPPPTLGGTSPLSSGGGTGKSGHQRERSVSATALASAWCSSTEFEAYVDEDEEDNNITSLHHVSPSPRLWMEDIEQSEGHGGAYTVMRCEIIEDDDDVSEGYGCGWKVWGQDFHLNRLRTSYIVKYGLDQSAAAVDYGGDDAHFETAIDETNSLISDMLDRAGDAMKAEMNAAAADMVPVVMLTILWTKNGDKDDDQLPIRVRAHGSIASVPSPRHGKISAGIQASVALPPITYESTLKRDWTSLPNRYENRPDAKDSSWCQDRRPLEELYKVDGMGEVLLARAIGGGETSTVGEFHGVELLEGLTSNLCVIYKDGTLRTAAAGGNVLRGCARHIVLEAAKRLGLQWDDAKPVLLQDAVDGMWSEVFITTAIRLVVPVASIAVPEYEEYEAGETRIGSFRLIWASGSANDEEERSSIGEKSWTEALYEDVCTYMYI